MKKLPVFITGNQHKADYMARQLGFTLEHTALNLDEIQSTDMHDIVSHKLRQAYALIRQPVLVEDTSLSFAALGELPGPFIKWFLEHAGAEACCRMLDGFADRSAIIRCTFGYSDGKIFQYFDSTMHGSISMTPKGKNGFGFDQIFIMHGDTRTRAELPQDIVEHTYAEQMKPFAQLRDYLLSA